MFLNVLAPPSELPCPQTGIRPKLAQSTNCSMVGIPHVLTTRQKSLASTGHDPGPKAPRPSSPVGCTYCSLVQMYSADACFVRVELCCCVVVSCVLRSLMF